MKEELKRISWREFLPVAAASSFLFVVFYFVFYLFYDPIHNFYPLISKDKVLVWFKIYLDPDGIELPVMAAGLIVYLFLAYLFIRNRKKATFFRSPLWQFLAIGAATFIIVRIKSYTFTIFSSIWLAVLIICVCSVVTFLLLRLYTRINPRTKTVIFWIFGLSFAAFILLALAPVSIYDYSFFLGPALKIAQGEKLGSFYMQYGLGLTYLFKLLMDLKLKVSQMQIILGFGVIAWFGMYWLLISRLIKNRTLAILCLTVLIILRYFAIFHDPTFIPAVSPLRLDLWVPLVLVIWQFGLNSFITSGFVATLYVLDDTFGLLYLLVYFLFILMGAIKRFDVKKLWLFLFPLCGLLWHYRTFGQLISIGSQLYGAVRLGFEPISLTSPFWALLFAIPYFLWAILQENNNKLVTFYLFLLSVGYVQLIYYFGRSNDQSLNNISGIFVLLLYISLSIMATKYRLVQTPTIIGSVFVVVTATLFSKDIINQTHIALVNVSHLKLENTSPVETYVDHNPHLLDQYDKNKVMLLTGLDSYYNYRYGLRQQGYYVPFAIHVYTDETIDYLIGKIHEGYTLLLWEDESELLIEQFNESQKLRDLGLQFSLTLKDKVFEVSLVKQKSVLKSHYQLGNILTISLPQTLLVHQTSPQALAIHDFSERFYLSMELSPSDYVDMSEGCVDMTDNSAIKIHGVDTILGVQIDRDGTKVLKLIVFKGGRAVKMEAWPVDQDDLFRFLRIMESIEFK